MRNVRLSFCFLLFYVKNVLICLLLLLCSIGIFAVLFCVVFVLIFWCFDCLYFCNEKCLIVVFSDLFYIVLCCVVLCCVVLCCVVLCSVVLCCVVLCCVVLCCVCLFVCLFFFFFEKMF